MLSSSGNPLSASLPAAEASGLGLPSGRLFWIIGFVYAVLMALMFQKLVLPLVPSMHAGHGLLYNDPTLFHTMAMKMAEQIQAKGWGQWALFPGPGAAGNVGLLAALYVFFGPDPACLIPFTAAAHATGALMLYRIGARIWPGRVGAVGGLVGGALFLVFPSALQWYGQNLKDSFAIAGILLMLYAHASLYSRTSYRFWKLLLITLVGGLLLAFVRPYFTVVSVAGFISAWLILVAITLVQKKFSAERVSLLRGLALIIVLGLVGFSSLRMVPDSAIGLEGAVSGGQNGVYVKLTGWSWKSSPFLPKFFDNTLKHMAETRAHFVGYNLYVGAQSGIDEEHVPGDALGMVLYAPRALVVALFTPFPDTWAERVSITRLVGAIETSIWYLLFPGLLLMFALRRASPSAIFCAVLCAGLLTLLGFIHPNVGTLYRQRFAYWMVILTIGAVGWTGFLLPRLARPEAGRKAGGGYTPGGESVSGANPAGGMDVVVAAGALVMAITMICYLGFIARDLLLVRLFGVTAQLDGYFFAAMLPTFFVSCLAIPMADAFMRYFVDSYTREGLQPAGDLARRTLWHGVVWLGIVAVVLAACAEPLMRLGLKSASSQDLSDAVTMFRCFLPILIISGWTVIGNAVLNGMHRYRVAAIAQLVVPFVTILSISFSPPELGLYPAVFGMVGGTFLNAAFIIWYLGRQGVWLWPTRSPLFSLPRIALVSYRQLALASLIGAAATPLGYALAGYVGAGAISIWALTSKMIILFGGLASVGVGAIILPRLSHMLRDRFFLLRNEVLVLLFGGSWIGGVIAALIFVFSVPIAAALVGDGMAEDRTSTFAEVLRIGALQIPMLISYTVMTKASAVIGVSARALVGSIIALVSYLVIALFAVEHLGVVGLAAASLISVVLSTIYLAAVVGRTCGFGVVAVMVLILGWIVWACICFAVVSGGTVMLVFALACLVGLGWIQVRAFATGSDSDQDVIEGDDDGDYPRRVA